MEWTVLIVDDEEVIVEVMKNVLQEKGFRVLDANTGYEALNIMKGHDIHIVITDLMMPGMDGVELLKRVKMEYPLVQVVLMTAFGTLDTIIDSIKKGAWYYLIKPIDLQKLLEVMNDIVEKQKAIFASRPV